MLTLTVKAFLLITVAVSLAHSNMFQRLEHGVGSFRKIVKQELEDVAYVKPFSYLKSAVRNMGIKLSASDQKILADGFQWKSCGPSDQLVDIHNLTINPSPLYFPGTLSFGFDIVFHDSIPQNAQVKGSLKLQFRRSSGDEWIAIPCLGQIGSCDYDDICSLSQAIPCPEELRQKGIPCTCPFNKGEYNLPNFDVEVDASVFLAGEYQGQAIFTDSSKGQIACYIVFFVVG